MSEKEDTISKMETVDQAAEKLYPIDGYMTEVDKYITYSKRHGFVCGANWQKEHCYTEQEVKDILEALRKRCAKEAKFNIQYDDLSEKLLDNVFFQDSHVCIHKQSILSVDYTDLLKTPQVK